MVTRRGPFSVSTLILRFVLGVTLMERNPRELPFPISALSHCLTKRSSTLCSVPTKWSPCRNPECLPICLSIWAVERVCSRRAQESTSCGTGAGQDPLFKLFNWRASKHTAQEREAVSQAGSLFRSLLYAFRGGNLTTTGAETGFTWHLIWCNRRLPWKGWPWSVLPLATRSCCFLWVISIDYGVAEQANGKITCQK